MVNIILPTFFVALASASRLARHADDMNVKPTTQAGAAVPSEAIGVVYVTATDYTTVYPTASQASAPAPSASVPVVDPKQPNASPSVALSSSLILYGSGLPGPSPLSSAPMVVSKTPEASATACKTNSSMAGRPTQLPPSFTLAPHGFPGYKRAPACSAAPVAPSNSAAPSGQSPTPTSMAATSTAIVIVPISLPVVLARSFDWSPESLSIALDKRQDDEPESTSTRTTTIKTTIVTSRLPSSTLSVSRSSTKSAVPTSSANTSSKPALSSASSAKPSKTDSAAVVTSVITGDGRCPYPYPGVHCGGPKTTLVTKTKSSQPTSTKKEEPKASASAKWCPYPGQKC